MKLKPFRKLYDWVLSWAEKPSAQYALFILAFAESSFFPVPPDILLIPLVLGYQSKWFRLVLVVSAGSILGGAFGYFIGHYLWWDAPQVPSSLAQFFFKNIPGFSESLFWKMQKQYWDYGFWIVFTAGFTPIPYKVFTISSGAFNLNLVTFMIASAVSRGARFFLVAFLIYKFGEPIKKFIDKWFNWLALLFAVLLIAGFLLIKGII
ncbi:MAG: DedA family protein [Candidatus Aminicenantes bacterium]|nr:DedA family protein [Candidatus Aminicenantes bacterium]NIM78489.1 DedA family protein [Candidatus Aminicenantes bacterium]NIN19910.1 DedA family protein [Candidatus Aminicenantes bacterium]NIN41627.1 DedA family protein [Candidatus Aminicenantes bacterium]NIN86536.1 DedA family protein [Candidatus Aminicenantes bacterium]